MRDRTALVLTNSEDATADYLCGKLDQEGVGYKRLNTDDVARKVRIHLGSQSAAIEWRGSRLDAGDVHSMIYRRPKPISSQADGDPFQRQHVSEEWAEAIEGFLAHIPAPRWINHPSCNFNASHKAEQLSRAQACGLSVPDWIVTNEPEVGRDFFENHAARVVVKPLASGYIERARPEDDTILYTQLFDRSRENLFGRLSDCPVLFQELIEKKADVRLIAVDGEMTAVCLVRSDAAGKQILDIRRDNMDGVAYSRAAIPADVETALRKLLSHYGLRFAAIDFGINEDGKWVFFEVNPNGQWAWLDIAHAGNVWTLFAKSLRRSVEV